MATDNGEVNDAVQDKAGEVKPAPSIVPTVGRMVLYTPAEGDPEHNHAQVLPATITAVHGNECINLKVFNDGVEDFWKTSVMQGEGAGTWDWMPFQKDQQARLAKEEQKKDEAPVETVAGGAPAVGA